MLQFLAVFPLVDDDLTPRAEKHIISLQFTAEDTALRTQQSRFQSVEWIRNPAFGVCAQYNFNTTHAEKVSHCCIV